MADIRKVTDDFSVAPQLAPGDMADAAAQGFVLVINNRPDDEVPGQPSNAQMEAAARQAGLDYTSIPFVGRPGDLQVDAVLSAYDGAGGPVLAFCRSGTRSITAWSIGQAKAGRLPREELLKLGAAAGYDLSGALG